MANGGKCAQGGFGIRFLYEQPLIIMEILWMLLIGLVVGIIAKFLMPGRDPGGMIVTMLLGVAGSFVAGMIGRALGWYAQGDPVGFIASVIGAILLLAIYRMFTRNRHRHV